MTYEFEVPFASFDRYTDVGPEMVDFEDADDTSGFDSYVVWPREEWERMGKPQRVRVTITPA